MPLPSMANTLGHSGLSFFSINKLGYDSVYAPAATLPAGSRPAGRLLEDDYVVYSPDQVLPVFAITVTTKESKLPTLENDESDESDHDD